MARRPSTVLIAAAVAGALQLGVAFLLATASGRGIFPVLRELAARLFGEGVRGAGPGGAALGLALHFTGVAILALVYVLAARRFAGLRTRPLLGGVGYGLLLGAAHWLVAPRGLPTVFPQVTAVDTAVALAAFVVCVGLPVGWIAARRAP